MNEYKITYAGESEGYRIITDRTEAAAKKFFREEAKSLDLGRITIESVELLNTNALASKRNERETLEIIRQLVADLGEQSYLATAFEGCFEDAESNIENDFGDSWKRRCESAEEKLRREIEEKQRVRDDAATAVKKLELDNRDLRSTIERVKANLARAEQALKDQSISPDDLEDIRQLLSDRAIKTMLRWWTHRSGSFTPDAPGWPWSSGQRRFPNPRKGAVLDEQTEVQEREAGHQPG